MIGTIIGVIKAVGGALITPTGIGVGIGAVVLAYVLKRIDNNWVYKPVYGVCYGVAATCTLGLSKWKWTRAVWNKTIEPFVVDLIDVVLSAVRDGILNGLHSDNK